MPALNGYPTLSYCWKSACRSEPMCSFLSAPVTVLHADVLVSAGSIEKFLWTKGTWCLFMSSKMNPKCSHCTTVHATFTAYKTFACTFRTCLCWLLWVSGDHVLFQWVLVLVCTVALVAYKVVFLTMREQIPDCVEHSTGAKYTIIKISWMEGLNMLPPVK